MKRWVILSVRNKNWHSGASNLIGTTRCDMTRRSCHLVSFISKLESDFLIIEEKRMDSSQSVQRSNLPISSTHRFIVSCCGQSWANHIGDWLTNVMVQERAEDISKSMVSPAECDAVVMKRLARFLTIYSSCLVHYRWQDVPAGIINGYSDADTSSRRSTSNDCIIYKCHLLVWCHELSKWSRCHLTLSVSVQRSVFRCEMRRSVSNYSSMYRQRKEISIRHDTWRTKRTRAWEGKRCHHDESVETSKLS